MRALEVDKELSPNVRRSFSVVPVPHSATSSRESDNGGGAMTELRTCYEATTNRLLRVAVNGFMESLGLLLGVMMDLDVDVLKDSMVQQ